MFCDWGIDGHVDLQEVAILGGRRFLGLNLLQRPLRIPKAVQWEIVAQATLGQKKAIEQNPTTK